MAKKTIKVCDFVIKMNKLLANSTCDIKVRDGIIFALESVLFDTGNYAGYRYLLDTEVPAGKKNLPGVRYDEEGNLLPYQTRFLNTDDSRRQYFLK